MEVMERCHIPSRRELLRRVSSSDLTAWAAWIELREEERKEAEEAQAAALSTQ